MYLLPLFILFVSTLLACCLPFFIKQLNEKGLELILGFSGAFLLSITFLHLLPETFEHFGFKAGTLILLGFFLQLFIQRITHGVEHGHHHLHEHAVSITPILLGLIIHSFMEGLPLGVVYRQSATLPSLFFAVGAHKIPEAIILALLVLQTVPNRTQAFIRLLVFSLITPLAALLAHFWSSQYPFIEHFVAILIPIVAGAFVHISTTIFFESGTKNHALTQLKLLAMGLGVGIAFLTLLFH